MKVREWINEHKVEIELGVSVAALLAGVCGVAYFKGVKSGKKKMLESLSKSKNTLVYSCQSPEYIDLLKNYFRDLNGMKGGGWMHSWNKNY